MKHIIQLTLNHRLELLLMLGLVAYVVISGITGSCAVCQTVTDFAGLSHKADRVRFVANQPELRGNTAATEVMDSLQSMLPPDRRKVELWLVNFWATWCAPCREEIPSLVAIQNRLASQGLQVVGVVVNSPASGVNRMVTEMGISYPVVPYDAEGYASLGRVRAIPMSVLLSPEGRILSRKEGFLSETQLNAWVQAHLNPKP